MKKIKTLIWFLKRPSYWHHMMALIARKAYPDKDTLTIRERSRAWAEAKARSIPDALAVIGLCTKDHPLPSLDPNLMNEAHELAAKSQVRMGGAGGLDLIYAAAALSQARAVVETGVAYGWSSLAILAAISDKDGARLFSVDMPYPKLNNEAFVGIAVPQSLRGNWHLIREPDRRGLEKAISQAGGSIDLCHYDSDKSYWGRRYAYPLIWEALRPGGIFISDDIQDNFAFKEFVEEKGTPFATVSCDGKMIGITRKPTTT